MTPSKYAKRPHNRWLLLIAIYKALLTLLFVFLGFEALHLLHKDVAGELSTLADHLHFSTESRMADFLLDKAQWLNDPRLRRIGAAAFVYAAVSLVEGIGLYLERAWGEYLTLAITASFLPLEMLEIVRRPTVAHAGLLAINLLVFLYLLKLTATRAHTRPTSTMR